MTVAALDASADDRVGLEGLAAVTFVVVGVAFSRVSESFEASAPLIPVSSALAVLAMGAALLSRSERQVARPMVAVACSLAALYLAVAAFSGIGARDPARSIGAIGVQLTGISICLAVVILITTPRRLDRALSGVVVATLVVASVNCLQVITGSYESTYGGLARAELAAIDTGEGWRLGGPLGDPNFFAEVLAVGVAISIVRLVADRRSGRRGGLALVASAIGMVTLFLTYSRGGLLAFTIALLVVSIRWLRWRAVVAAVVLGLLVIAVTPSSVKDRFATAVDGAPKALAGQPVADTAINGRASEAIVGFRAFSDHPVLGVGIGNYELHYLDYASQVGLDVRGEERGAHSLVLETLAEMGILGLGALTLTALLAFAAIASLRGERGAGDADSLWWCALAVEAGLVAHLASAVFLHNSFPRGLWLLLGLALACGQVRQPRTVTRAA